MFKLKYYFIVSLITLLPFTPVKSEEFEDDFLYDQRNMFNEEQAIKSKHHHHSSSKFRLKDFEGSFIGRGVSAGGDQQTSTTSIFRIKSERNGTGTITFYSSRTYSSPRLVLTNIPITITTNDEGVGELIIPNFPVQGYTTYFDMVAQKNYKNKVTGAFAMRSRIEPTTIPPALQPFANEIISFELTRQIQD